MEVMDMLMEKVVMMVSQMYTYPKLIKFCMLIFNVQFFVKQTSTKWFEKKKKKILCLELKVHGDYKALHFCSK